MRKVLVISLVANVWFALVIANLESFRYATQVGLCSQEKVTDGKIIRTYDGVTMYSCLSEQKPRTSIFWNFLYGVRAL